MAIQKCLIGRDFVTSFPFSSRTTIACNAAFHSVLWHSRPEIKRQGRLLLCFDKHINNVFLDDDLVGGISPMSLVCLNSGLEKLRPRLYGTLTK
jgi:hypothetical protein